MVGAGRETIRPKRTDPPNHTHLVVFRKQYRFVDARPSSRVGNRLTVCLSHIGTFASAVVTQHRTSLCTWQLLTKAKNVTVSCKKIVSSHSGKFRFRRRSFERWRSFGGVDSRHITRVKRDRFGDRHAIAALGAVVRLAVAVAPAHAGRAIATNADVVGGGETSRGVVSLQSHVARIVSRIVVIIVTFIIAENTVTQ